MSKYNRKLDLNHKNSLSVIIDRIKPGSVILEFGPSTGFMTQHLKESMGCTVYAVEIDEEAAKDAALYAEDIIVDNIENYFWLKKYQNIKFDYIIFADVLEHLYDYETVLKKSKLLLSENGSILISIPNIAHNSIIIDLLKNEFNYHSTGLLDNTHIRFFTKKTFDALISKCGLSRSYETAIFERPENTEFLNSYDDLPYEVKSYLMSMRFGEAYQFIYELKTHNDFPLISSFMNDEKTFSKYFIQLFFDLDDGFSEENSIRKFVSRDSELQEITFDLSNESSIKALRIDPLNDRCVVEIMSLKLVKKDEESNLLPLIYSNASSNENMIFYFNTNDSQIYFSGIDQEKLDNAQKIIMKIRYKYINKNAEYACVSQLLKERDFQLNQMESKLLSKDYEIERNSGLVRELEEKENAVQRLNNELEQIHASLAHEVERNSGLVRELEEKENAVQRLNNELEQIHASLAHEVERNSGLVRELEEKENAVQRLNNELEQIHASLAHEVERNSGLVRELEEKENAVQRLNNELEQYSSNLALLFDIVNDYSIKRDKLNNSFMGSVFFNKNKVDKLNIKIRKLLDMANKEVLSKYIENNYLDTNADVKSLVDTNMLNCGLEHFLLFGYQEVVNRKRYSREFDTMKNNRKGDSGATFVEADENSQYKDDALDIERVLVEEKTMNPTKFQLKKAGLNQEEFNLIASAFDAQYYLSQYLDIQKAGIDPLIHYITYGSREGRNPSKDFHTSFYLDTNPDVKEANVEPFYHYLISGKMEGRVAQHPGGYKANALKSVQSLDITAKNWLKSSLVCQSKEILIAFIEKLNLTDSRGVILSLGHDKYLDHVGGVQLCIGDEEKKFNSENFIYINISPAQPLPMLAEDNKPWSGNLIINQQDIGIFDSEDIIEVLITSISALKINSILTIHALHGHSIPFLIRIAHKLDIKKSFFWIHDYFSLCAGYNLLRNDTAYCNAPVVESQGCSICIYGENRKNHIQKMSELFDAFKFDVISPSQHALDIWQRSSAYKYRSAKVLHHRNITRTEVRRVEVKPLNIAFLGHPATHKGWETFKYMVNSFKNDDRFKFFHLGLNQDKICSAEFYEVRSTWNNLTAMTDAIKRNDIHAVFIWSIWPETYNITMYEAQSAGAVVLTVKDSGNVAVEINNSGLGIVYDNEVALFESMESGELILNVKTIFDNGVYYGNMSSSGVTSALISKEM